MTNNDILRRLRYALDINDAEVSRIFELAGEKPKPGQVFAWMRLEEHEEFKLLPDPILCRFLDGLIVEKRGPRPDGLVPAPLEILTNNEILKKIRIAFALREEEVLKVFKLADFVVTKAELGSFYRKEGQRNYAKCPEQVLRKFLQGLGKMGGMK